MKIEILEHKNIIVDGIISWVDKGDTFTQIGSIFQDNNSCFQFNESELKKISYKII